MAKKNLVAEYAKREKIGTIELAKRLETSKGCASDLLNGNRWPGPELAGRLARLTGKPWHIFVKPPN